MAAHVEELGSRLLLGHAVASKTRMVGAHLRCKARLNLRHFLSIPSSNKIQTSLGTHRSVRAHVYASTSLSEARAACEDSDGRHGICPSTLPPWPCPCKSASRCKQHPSSPAKAKVTEENSPKLRSCFPFCSLSCAQCFCRVAKSLRRESMVFSNDAWDSCSANLPGNETSTNIHLKLIAPAMNASRRPHSSAPGPDGNMDMDNFATLKGSNGSR